MSALALRRSAATAIAALMTLALLLGPSVPDAQAQVEGHRVEFTVTIDDGDIDGDDDAQLRAARQRQLVTQTIARIEQRLDAIGLTSHNVRADDAYRIRVTVYGNHDATAIKSTVIPSGQLEIRPVLVDGSHWYNLAARLPADVELRAEPGSFRTDRLFLFSNSAQQLHQALDLVDLDSDAVRIFPHEEGWRAVELGSVAATQRDIVSADLERTPSGIPFVRTELTAEAAQRVRSTAAGKDARYLAILLDGELVALQRFSQRQFSETLDIDPPSHLRSTTARTHWGYQVGGRLAASIPLQLAELQE